LQFSTSKAPAELNVRTHVSAVAVDRTENRLIAFDMSIVLFLLRTERKAIA